MTFFTPTELEIFADPHATDPSSDVDRVRLRDKMVWLHEQIYPEIRARRWDLRAHWTPQYLISTARLSRAVPRIDFLLLRYSKAETIVKLMKKELGADFSHPYGTALLGVRASAHGLDVELFVSDAAWADGQNFKNKLVHGAPEKRHLRQIFAELGGDYTMTFEATPIGGREVRTRVLSAKCSRLVNLGTLDSTLSKYAPAEHELRVATHFASADPRLEAEILPSELLYRMGQLYLLYQFVSWSPRNDYLPRPKAMDRESESNR